MKSKVYLFAILSTLLSMVCTGCGEENLGVESCLLGEKVYYRVGDKKIYLHELKHSFVVQMDTSISYDAALRKLTVNPHMRYVTFVNKKRYVHLVASDKLSLEKVKQQEGVINAIHQYVLGEDAPFAPISPHGTLALKLKPEVALSEVLSLIDNKAKPFSENKWGTIEIEVFNWKDLFDFCEKIFESGKVEFCEPVFSGGYVR